MITASHNPHEWNGFKFLAGPDNTVLDAEETQELFRLYQETPFPGGKENLIGEFRHLEGKTSQAHVRRVLELIDKDLIRSRRFSVAMDPGQGAGEESCRLLLEELGCSVVEVASNRESEPTPENLWELCESVRTRKCDLGVAQDLDADRLALVSEEGEAIGEEYTLCFAVGHLLRRNHGRHPMVVVNSSTTHVIAELARLYGADLVETRVGEVNLSRALKIYSNLGRTTFGGEGNGGVIYPPVIYGRDSLIALGLILEEMAQTGKSIRALRDELPRMFLYKAKFPRAEDKALEPVFDDLQSRFPAADVSFMDGLKMSWPDGSWLQIRPSNTEPIVRVMVESKDNRWAADTFALLKGML
jgi:phosphomannomutase